MGRSSCCSKEGLNRGAWTEVEDKILRDFIEVHGEGKWMIIPKKTGLKRCGKSCRLRWLNYLRPDIKRGNITHEEEELIIRLHKLLGNRWSLIAGRIPGRTDNEIKNYWNTKILGKKIQPPISTTTTFPKSSSYDHSIEQLDKPNPTIQEDNNHTNTTVKNPNANIYMNPEPHKLDHQHHVHQMVSSSSPFFLEENKKWDCLLELDQTMNDKQLFSDVFNVGVDNNFLACPWDKQQSSSFSSQNSDHGQQTVLSNENNMFYAGSNFLGAICFEDSVFDWL